MFEFPGELARLARSTFIFFKAFEVLRVASGVAKGLDSRAVCQYTPTPKPLDNSVSPLDVAPLLLALYRFQIRIRH